MLVSTSIEFLSVTVPGGGCCSLGCRGYLRPLLEARILLGTTTCFNRHLLQAHLLAMSLISGCPSPSWMLGTTLSCEVMCSMNIWLNQYKVVNVENIDSETWNKINMNLHKFMDPECEPLFL